MDIRNFFGPKKGTTAGGTVSAKADNKQSAKKDDGSSSKKGFPIKLVNLICSRTVYIKKKIGSKVVLRRGREELTSHS